MDEIEAGIKKFHELLKGLDAAVEAVVPVKPANGIFLISLTKGPNRKFVTIPEDDIIDLPNDADIRSNVTKVVQDALAGM